MAEISDLGSRRRRGARCPICGKPPVQGFKPFCSARCKTVDLGRWLGGAYRIETNEMPDEAELIDLVEASRNKPEP